jgi:serine/threonine protein kinase
LLFPSFNKVDNIAFQYVGGLVRNVFHVHISSGSPEFGILKFTRHYNVDVHRKLEELGLAPVLIAHELCFGWKVILMEDARREGFVTLSDITFENIETVNEVMQAVLTALVQIHDTCHVIIADLRAPNILIRIHDLAIKFIDFDWSGEIGDSWPLVAKNESINWPPNSDPGNALTFEHDFFMIDELRKDLEATI